MDPRQVDALSFHVMELCQRNCLCTPLPPLDETEINQDTTWHDVLAIAVDKHVTERKSNRGSSETECEKRRAT